MSIRQKVFVSTILLVLTVSMVVAGVAIFQQDDLKQNVIQKGEENIESVNGYTISLLESVNYDVAVMLASDLLEWIYEYLAVCQNTVHSAADYMEMLYERPGQKTVETGSVTVLPGTDRAQTSQEYMQIEDMQSYLVAQRFDTWEEGVAMYIVTESGMFFYSADTGVGTGEEFHTDLRQRAWYKTAKETGQPFWTDMYEDSVDDKHIISYCYPVYQKDEFKAVVGIDIPMESIIAFTLGPETENMTDVCLVDEKSNIIYSLNDTDGLNNYVMQNSSNIDQAFADDPASPFHVVHVDEESMAALVRLPEANWTLVLYSHFGNVRDAATDINQVVAENNNATIEYFDRTITQNILFFIIIDVIVIVAGILVARRNTERVIKPIETLEAMAKQVGEGNLDVQFDAIKTGDETEKIAESFNNMVGSLKEYINNLATVTAEKKRVETELDIANRIQKSMLPTIFPPFPDRDEFDVRALMNPAKEVGGDFYDFFMTDDDHVAMVVADVSGKGVGAALFMVITKTLIKNEAQTGACPADVFTKVNQALCSGNDEEMFVTAFLCVLEISTGALTCVNAGHNPPVLIGSDSSLELIKIKRNPALASWDGRAYQQEAFRLTPGQKLFLYTDGVTEAYNSDYEEFGTERMCDALRELNSQGANLEETIAQMRKKIDEFAGDEEQADDITMLMMEYSGCDSTSTLHLTADTKNLDALNEFLEEKLEDVGFSMKDTTQLLLAAEEVFVNIAHYAYGENEGSVRVSCEASAAPAHVVLEFRDSGVPFDPLAKEDADTGLTPGDREPGGLGIFLTKKVMDSVSYRYENGYNILRLEKSAGKDDSQKQQ
ncbi:SpoIIE family protein phosphatase [Christensenellaceae bacterium OttesenSCG-928-K19]|nr:SpoIIE family protein phosphatase [Christensenellaceae bacterium OttesenSCG-928-K19]